MLTSINHNVIIDQQRFKQYIHLLLATLGGLESQPRCHSNKVSVSCRQKDGQQENQSEDRTTHRTNINTELKAISRINKTQDFQ